LSLLSLREQFVGQARIDECAARMNVIGMQKPAGDQRAESGNRENQRTLDYAVEAVSRMAVSDGPYASSNRAERQNHESLGASLPWSSSLYALPRGSD
jgi:hypothetical protein